MGQKRELDWTDFPSLIRSIAERDHEGVVLRIAPELDVSTALVNQWVHGLIKSPSTHNLYKLSQRYGVPFLDLVALVAQGASRGKAPRRQGRRTAGGLLLAFAVGTASTLGWPSGGVRADAGTLHAVQVLDNVSLIRRWALRLLQNLAGRLLLVSCAA